MERMMLRLPSELRERLRTRAKSDLTTETEVIRRACVEYTRPTDATMERITTDTFTPQHGKLPSNLPRKE